MVSPFTALRTKAQAPTLPDHVIVFIEADGEYSYSIDDITGKNLLNGKYEGGSIDVSNLPAGFYILKFEQEDKEPVISKFSKQ